MTDVGIDIHRATERQGQVGGAAPSAPPRFDEDDEYDANGWERVPTWERRGRI